MSMAHSLEARVPFLDPGRRRARARAPAGRAVRGLRQEAPAALGGRAARRAATSSRGRKKGFSIPAAAWLRGELEPFAREVLAPARMRRQGYFEPAVVTRLIDEHVARREDHSRQLWGLMSFSLWRDAA